MDIVKTGSKAVVIGAMAMVGGAAAGAGCLAPPSDAGCVEEAVVEEGNFAAPSAVAVAGDYLFVANASFRYVCGEAVYDPASVTVVALEDLSIAGRIPTSAPNAQFLTVAAGSVWAVSSGASRFDGAVVWPDGPGALDRIDLGVGGAAPDALAASFPIPAGGAAAPLAGYPTRAALAAGAGVALTGSGTAGVVFRLDLAGGAGPPTEVPEVLDFFGAAGPSPTLNASAEVRIEGGATHVLGFNDDAYCLASGDGGAVDPTAFTCADVGERPDFIEGPLDLALDLAGSSAWVVFSPANAVYRIDLAGGMPAFSGEVVPTGVAPNRIVRDEGAPGNRFLVVSSGSNAVYEVVPGAPEAVLLTALPPATNPYDLAVDRGPFAPPGGRAFVPGLISDDVTVIDLDGGAILEVLR